MDATFKYVSTNRRVQAGQRIENGRLSRARESDNANFHGYKS